MKLLYPHLLLYRETVENIIKLTLERIAVGDAPFLSTICKDTLRTARAQINLTNPVDDIVNFIGDTFSLSNERKQWKDIRKHGIRNILLHRYVSRMNISTEEKQTYLLLLHLSLSAKKIHTDVELSEDSFNIKVIHSH